jgi:O-acetyl-ADP-ribose deacetylase (regulator of RNase III)
MEPRFLNGRVIVKVGDITLEEVDAVVNAANSTLLGGSGVDGAIHAKGGPAILAECEEIRRTQYADGMPTGEAVITTGGDLPAKHVIHTVGPIYGRHGGSEPSLLAKCYANSLHLAAANGLGSIAFPAISTGVYAYPKPEAAIVASDAIKTFVAADSSISDIRLVFYSQRDADVFLEHNTFR